MKKNGILNSEISKVLSDLGHTDYIVIADCGLPILKGVKKIDLALKLGLPRFMEVVEEVAKDMEIEKITIAEEMEDKNPLVHKQISDLFKDKDFSVVDHEELKILSEKSVAVIRTGECTPYANCILHAGVIF